MRSREVSKLHTGDSFVASVRFLTTEEGGRRRPPRNPAISQVGVARVQLSCYVVAIDDDGFPLATDKLTLGRRYRARVVVPTACYYQREFESFGRNVEFFEGAKCVALGIVEDGDWLEETSEVIDRFIKKAWG